MRRARRGTDIGVKIPAGLRPLTGGQSVVRVSGGTVGEVLAALEGRWPAVRSRLRDPKGQLRPHILVFLNTEDIRAKEGESTPVGEGDELRITPTIEGG